MIDWFVLLTPLLLLAILTLFAFVGCEPGKLSGGTLPSVVFRASINTDEVPGRVTLVVFRWTIGYGPEVGIAFPDPEPSGVGKVELGHTISAREEDRWAARCHVFYIVDGYEWLVPHEPDATCTFNVAEFGPHHVDFSVVLTASGDPLLRLDSCPGGA